MADLLKAKKRDGSIDDAGLATTAIRDLRAAADCIEELEAYVHDFQSRPAVPPEIRESWVLVHRGILQNMAYHNNSQFTADVDHLAAAIEKAEAKP